MRRHVCSHTIYSVALTLASLSLFTVEASAQQRGGGRGFGSVSAVSLAGLDEVKAALKLSEGQVKEAAAIAEKLSADRRDAFQNAGQDFAAAMEAGTKLATDAHAKLNAKLDDVQVKRLYELYTQVNGVVVMHEEPVQKSLTLTAEQVKKLDAVRTAMLEKSRDLFQGFQDLSDDERAKKRAEYNKIRDEGYLAVLTDEQKTAFEKSKGEKLEIDLSKLPRFGGGGNR